MKKLLFLILFLAAVGVGLMVTCPDQAAHREASKGVISEVVEDVKAGKVSDAKSFLDEMKTKYGF